MVRPTPAPVIFELDWRVEALSALLLLARPRRGLGRYGEAVMSHFLPYSPHPAVAALGNLRAGGTPPPLVAEVCLLRPAAGTLETPDLKSFFDAADDFARASGAERFLESRRRDLSAFVSLARAEHSRAQRPVEVSAYLKEAFPGTCRVVLAPLLPREWAVNISRAGVETRLRCATVSRGATTFELDAFDACVAHERTHTIVAPLVAAMRARFEALPGRPPAACRDRASWEGCYEEHLVRAITLRARARAGDPRGSAAVAARWSRSGYPYLVRFFSLLEEFESLPVPGGFSSFHPRLARAFLLESGA